MRICTDCQSLMEEEVLKSKLGYYVGYHCKCGLYERISKYWANKKLADEFLNAINKLTENMDCSEEGTPKCCNIDNPCLSCMLRRIDEEEDND